LYAERSDVTGDAPTDRHRLEYWTLLSAYVLGERTVTECDSRTAVASKREHHRKDAGTRCIRIGARMSGEQRLGIRMLRVGEDGRGRALLDDLPQVHHCNVVGHLRDERQLVGDEDQAEIELRQKLALVPSMPNL